MFIVLTFNIYYIKNKDKLVNKNIIIINYLKGNSNKWTKQRRYKNGAPYFYLNRALYICLPPSRSVRRSLPTLVSDTSRGESRACLFCQWNNDNVIARARFATASLPRGRRLDADMLIWRPFRDIKFSVYRFSPDEPRLDVHITFRHCAFNHGIRVFFGDSMGSSQGRHESYIVHKIKSFSNLELGTTNSTLQNKIF